MKTTAPHTTPSPNGGLSQPTSETDNRSPRAEFLVAALNMTWQLAIVVLVPIVGGYKLDQRFNSTPLLTIVGLVVAMFGTAIVLWRQLQLFGPPPKTGAKGHHS